MDATSVLLMVFLAALAANVVDWLVLRRGVFVWTPTGPGLYVWQTCAVLISVTAAASFLPSVPSSLLHWVAVPPFTILQLGAIWSRHESKQPRES